METAEITKTEREPLACGCIPFTGIRCAEATRLWNEHAGAWRAKNAAYATFASHMTPANREALVDAWDVVHEAWHAYEQHLGEAV